MIYIKLFLKLVPYILSLVKAVEDWMEGESGLGQQKKEAVETGVQTIFNGLDAETTGGAHDTWDRIKPTVSKTIDFIVSIVFNLNR